MSDSLVATKRRIQTIQSTEKITKAMKLVASVKFQKWHKLLENNKAYTSGMENVMKKTVSAIDFSKVKMPDCLQHFSDTKNLYVVVTSSLGLCGSYNYNLFRLLDPLLKPDDEIIVLGQKGYLHYKESSYILHEDYVNLMDEFTFNNVKAMRHFFLR
jgi:F-type H+-transporting ATPase subunit gamma